MEILRVASSSSPKSVAGAIAAVVEQDQKVVLLAVGAGAVVRLRNLMLVRRLLDRRLMKRTIQSVFEAGGDEQTEGNSHGDEQAMPLFLFGLAEGVAQ